MAVGARPTLGELLVEAGFKPDTGLGEAAIWRRDDASGEVLEFLVPHAGTARQLGRITPLTEHTGVGAISLSDLEVLQEHTQELRIPVSLPAGRVVYLPVRVPRLGAFMVNKAATFPQAAAHRCPRVPCRWRAAFEASEGPPVHP